jgi:hypothetical protein
MKHVNGVIFFLAFLLIISVTGCYGADSWMMAWSDDGECSLSWGEGNRAKQLDWKGSNCFEIDNDEITAQTDAIDELLDPDVITFGFSGNMDSLTTYTATGTATYTATGTVSVSTQSVNEDCVLRARVNGSWDWVCPNNDIERAMIDVAERWRREVTAGDTDKSLFGWVTDQVREYGGAVKTLPVVELEKLWRTEVYREKTYDDFADWAMKQVVDYVGEKE